MTESGRALTAHHSVLVFNVLGTNEMRSGQIPEPLAPRRAPRHPAALRDLRGRLAARTSRRPTTTRCRSRKRRSPPSTSATSTCKARARVEQLFWATVREDPEDRARPAVRARRARGPREAAGRHLLLQLLAVPVDARPLGGAPALPHHADPPPERGADAARGAGRPHLRQRRQDGPVHRPARRQARARAARA